MQQPRDAVRAKADEMRKTGFSRAHSREEVVAALSNAMPAPALATQQQGGTVYLCPWHTCQATRHG